MSIINHNPTYLDLRRLRTSYLNRIQMATKGRRPSCEDFDPPHNRFLGYRRDVIATMLNYLYGIARLRTWPLFALALHPPPHLCQTIRSNILARTVFLGTWQAPI